MSGGTFYIATRAAWGHSPLRHRFSYTSFLKHSPFYWPEVVEGKNWPAVVLAVDGKMRHWLAFVEGKRKTLDRQALKCKKVT